MKDVLWDAWRDAWVASTETGEVRLKRDKSGREYLAVIGASASASASEPRVASVHAEILDDGRSVGVNLGDRVAYGLVPRPGKIPIAVNIYKLVSKARLETELETEVKRPKFATSEASSGRNSAGIPAGKASGKCGKGRQSGLMRMLGVVQKLNPKTGRLSVFCQDISDVYGRDAQLPASVEGLRPGDRVQFDVEEKPKSYTGTIFALNVSMVAPREKKRRMPVLDGDGEDEDLFPELVEADAADDDVSALNEAELEESEATMRLEEELQKLAEEYSRSLRPADLPTLPTQRPSASAAPLSDPDSTAGWIAAQARLFGNLPPLPAGWIRIRSKTHGKVYFYNTINGKSTDVEPR